MKMKLKEMFASKELLPYVILILIGLLVPVVFQVMIPAKFWMNVSIVVLFNCICSVSLRTVSLSGNMSFAHGAWVGIGAYTSAILAKTCGVPIFLSIPAGGVLATALALLTGFPFARLRSIYYGMTTMFLGTAVIYVIYACGSLTGGYTGFKRIPALFSTATGNYYFFLVLAVVSIAAMYRFEHSRIGTTLSAISQSHVVAASIGINEAFYRLLAVGFGSFFAGIAGAAYAHYNTVISPSTFGTGFGLWLIMYVYIGGQSKVLGPIIGTIVLVTIPECFRGLSSSSPFATAAALMLVAFLLPGGLVSIPGLIRKQADTAKIRVRARKGGGVNDA